MDAKMKSIRYRGGLVEFSIPASWSERNYPKGGGEYWDPAGGSGTLRLNVLTFMPPSDASDTWAEGALRQIAMSQRGKTKWEVGVTASGEQFAEGVATVSEGGDVLRMYSWLRTATTVDKTFRIASFTYCILDSEASANPGLLHARLNLVRREVMAARVSTAHGEAPK